MKDNIIDDFNLPGYVKGKSFAEASKAIDRKFKDREDSFSEDTKKELLSRLADAQEHVKMQENAKAKINKMSEGGWSDMTGMEKTGAITGMAGTALQLGNMAFGDTGVDTTGQSGRVQGANEAGMILGGAAQGASAGAALGAPGAIVGGLIGGGLGLLGAGNQNKDALEANKNAGLRENNQFTNDFAGGGYIDPNLLARLKAPQLPNFTGTSDDLHTGDPTIDYGTVSSRYTPTHTMGLSGKKSPMGVLNNNYSFTPEGVAGANNVGDLKQSGKLEPPKKDWVDKTANFLGENYDSILNTAPILNNAYQLATIDRANPISYDRLDQRYRRNIVDERALENKIQNEATNTARALAGATNGSAGALRANLLGSQLVKTNALSDAYLKATQMNHEDDRFGQQFDAQKDMINQRTSMLETNERRADDAAYENNKSMMMSALAQNIGDFGKQQMHKKLAIKATDYGWDGKYYVSKDGTRLTPEEYNKIFGIKTEKKNGESK